MDSAFCHLESYLFCEKRLQAVAMYAEQTENKVYSLVTRGSYTRISGSLCQDNNDYIEWNEVVPGIHLMNIILFESSIRMSVH